MRKSTPWPWRGSRPPPTDCSREIRNDPADLTTIYGRTLWRVQQAGLTHGIRAILWHQGENNQGSASPTGDYDWKSYQDYLVALSAAWKQDFPNLQHYYVFQIWPNACSMAGTSGSGDILKLKAPSKVHKITYLPWSTGRRTFVGGARTGEIRADDAVSQG